QDYHQQSSLQETLAREKLAHLVLHGDEQVLDIGCGDGKTTAQIAASVPRGAVLGIDPSHDMVAFASSHYGPPTHPNLRFEVGDARTLTFSSSFDLIVSFYALHWVHEQKAALRCIRAALKPTGRTLFQFVSRGARPSFEDILHETAQSASWSRYFQGFAAPHAQFTPETYRELAERAGLRVIQLTVEDRVWDFGTRDDFLGFIRATFIAWVDRVPEDERVPFIYQAIDRY
ncbi:MAG: methyltransferase domain-containing protein, partial [Acidobacteria bacterium]|nr:methyltransferase domain-containing protein [Acidobacteriota bacterium]NIQ84226.1 methyltransferase domain-containing protein [Acidobacteriota bacterium]